MVFGRVGCPAKGTIRKGTEEAFGRDSRHDKRSAENLPVPVGEVSCHDCQL